MVLPTSIVSRNGFRLKKLILPSIMAVLAVISIAVIAVSVSAKTPVTLKMLRIDTGLEPKDYNLAGGDTITLATGVDYVNVDARPTDGAAIVKITGDGKTTPLVQGKNTLSIKVFGSDGKSSAEYKLYLIVPKLEGWCLANADLIKTIEQNWTDEQIYQMPGYADLGSYAADIKAHMSCFTDSLQKEITKNY